MSGIALCSASTLAKLFVLSERRIRQLATTGVIPKAQEGQYHVMATVNAYVLFLRERRRLNSDPAAMEMAQERLRLLRARADRADYENQMLCGAWVEVNAVKQLFEEVGAVFTACVDALPGRLAFELTGIEDPAVMKAKLFDACRQLRNLTGERLDELETLMRDRGAAESADQGYLSSDAGSVGGLSSAFTAGECRTGALAEQPYPLHDSDCASVCDSALQTGDCGDGEPDG